MYFVQNMEMTIENVRYFARLWGCFLCRKFLELAIAEEILIWNVVEY